MFVKTPLMRSPLWAVRLAVPELLYRLTWAWDLLADGAVGADDPAEWDAFYMILFALGKLRDGRAVEMLADFLDYPDNEALDQAATALYRIGEAGPGGYPGRPSAVAGQFGGK